MKEKQKCPYKFMWPELIPGRLIRRYKRFLADVELHGGKTVTAHCANSGKMTECCRAGRPVWLSFHDNPKRKLKYTWELIEMPGSPVGVNTQVPNPLVAESVKAGCIPELSGYSDVRREVKAGTRSRLDILLRGAKRADCYVEVKNCTLVQKGMAAFPDAVSLRGQKHLTEMEKLIAAGHRCVMFYLIQRMDAEYFRPADFIDPEYGKKLRQAHKKGVEILVYDVAIDHKSVCLRRKIPCIL